MKIETPMGRSTRVSPEPQTLRASAAISAPRSQSTLAKGSAFVNHSDRKSPFDMMKGISNQLANVTV